MPPKQKALEKQQQLQAERDKKSEEERNRKEAEDWAVGAKDDAKQRIAEEKEKERLRKAADMAAALAADEAETSAIVKKKVIKKKGKDDFDMLNAALANQPKTKAQKDAELKKKMDDERKQKEAEAKRLKDEARKAEDDEIRKMAAKGIIMNHTDDLFIPINNHLDEDDFEDGTGVDAALDVLSLKGGKADEHPERRQKALYNAFYERQIVVLREENPNLKLSQYKDRIFDLWKNSPENPRNQKSRARPEEVYEEMDS
eukprot:gene6786-9296_t